MNKKIKITIALLIAISSFTAIVVLANEVNQYYLPVVNQNYSSQPTPTPTPRIAITGFHPSNNPQEDYVTLKNTTGGTIDMTDWWMKAENQSGRYNFPSGFELGANKTVNVRSGVGTDTATNLYIGLPFSLWTVVDNCAYLRDNDGNLEDKQCVGQAPPGTPEPSVYISGFNASSNPQNDYVTIANSTTNSFDMTGWWMKAESESGRYDFPIGYILGSGKTVNIVSGVGTDTAANLYIGRLDSLWTSQNNCAYLRYKDGTLLDKRCVNE